MQKPLIGVFLTRNRLVDGIQVGYLYSVYGGALFNNKPLSGEGKSDRWYGYLGRAMTRGS